MQQKLCNKKSLLQVDIFVKQILDVINIYICGKLLVVIIIIIDPETPYFFRDTRLNKKVYTVKRNKFALMVIVCSAGGAPKPKITWYKVNEDP